MNEEDGYSKIDDFGSFKERYNFGRIGESKFQKLWNQEYERNYGMLIEEDGIKTDFYAPRLHLYIDTKRKSQLGSVRAIYTKELYLEKKSVDVKWMLQIRNIDHHYVFAVEFEEVGWLATNASAIPTDRPYNWGRRNYSVRGSGRTIYIISMEIFKPLDLFLKEGEWDGEHKFSDTF